MISILLALVIVGILLLVVSAGQSDEFKISRSTRIFASPEKVFPHVNELNKWDAWSPWAKLDPNAKSIFEGPAAGIGSAMAWSGNKKIGEGRMTITASHPHQLISFRLEFLRPFKTTNTAEFEFKPSGDGTVVVWSMAGRSNFFFKVFGLFLNCDEMAGKDFEKGLASLKSLVEAPAS